MKNAKELDHLLFTPGNGCAVEDLELVVKTSKARLRSISMSMRDGRPYIMLLKHVDRHWNFFQKVEEWCTCYKMEGRADEEEERVTREFCEIIGER